CGSDRLLAGGPPLRSSVDQRDSPSTAPRRPSWTLNTVDQSPSSDAPNVDVEATAVERRSAPIMRTALALFSVQGLTWASSLVGVLFVPRFLGANGLGAYAAITTAVALISLVASLGTANHVVREVARNPA